MIFIGIVSNKISPKQANRILDYENLDNNYKILFINDRNINNFRNISFDTLLVNDSIMKKSVLKNMVKKTRYIIVNSDIDNGVENIDGKNIIITYGFTRKSTVSISSVEGENLLLAIQRNIRKNNGEVIENQEIYIKKEVGINMHVQIGGFIINKIYS